MTEAPPNLKRKRQVRAGSALLPVHVAWGFNPHYLNTDKVRPPTPHTTAVVAHHVHSQRPLLSTVVGRLSTTPGKATTM